MPTYITLMNYTQEGIANIDESPERVDQAKELARSLDSQITSFYLTFGQYDAVVVSEAPDDETAARLALTVMLSGSVTGETLKAFTEDEYRDVIAGLPE